MALQHDVNLMSLPAGADLSSAQYHFVELASDGECILVDAAGAASIGINYGKPSAAGTITSIRPLDGNIALVEAAEAITIGGFVASNAAGEAIALVTGHVPLGVALTTGVNGTIMRIITINQGAIIAA